MGVFSLPLRVALELTQEQRTALDEARVPIQTLIDHGEGGSTIEEFLADFPTVSRTQALKFIELSACPLIR
jgi:hypothetical protein